MFMDNSFHSGKNLTDIHLKMKKVIKDNNNNNNDESNKENNEKNKNK